MAQQARRSSLVAEFERQHADLVQTYTELTKAQNSYQAALQSGAKIMQLSLLNYIQ